MQTAKLPRIVICAIALTGIVVFSSCVPVIRAVGEVCSQPIIEVNTTEDATGRDEVCRPGERCTLRAALTTAAFCRDYPARNTQKTIGLPAGRTFLISSAYTSSRLFGRLEDAHRNRIAVGLPRIYGNVLIEGRDATIDGGDHFRLFHITEGGVLEIRNLTLTRASARVAAADGTVVSIGSAIYNEGRVVSVTSRFVRNDLTAIYNASLFGGNIGLPESAPSPMLSLRECILEENGRAILNEGTLDVTGGSFLSNRQPVDVPYRGGVLRDGSALYNIRTATVDGVTFSANVIERDYSGVVTSVNGQMTIRRSTFVRNRAPDGAVLDLEGPRSILIDQSSFVNNESWRVVSLLGGSGLRTVQRSTFDGGFGSAIVVCFADCFPSPGDGCTNLVLKDVTMHGFTATRAGLIVGSRCGAKISNSLIENARGPNCEFMATPVLEGRSLSSEGTCGFAVRGPARLGLLGLHGAATENRVPEIDSPALNAGSICLRADQRDAVRPTGTACDIGSIERQTNDQ
jgi:hypothetical protein